MPLSQTQGIFFAKMFTGVEIEIHGTSYLVIEFFRALRQNLIQN